MRPRCAYMPCIWFIGNRAICTYYGWYSTKQNYFMCMKLRYETKITRELFLLTFLPFYTISQYPHIRSAHDNVVEDFSLNIFHKFYSSMSSTIESSKCCQVIVKLWRCQSTGNMRTSQLCIECIELLLSNMCSDACAKDEADDRNWRTPVCSMFNVHVQMLTLTLDLPDVVTPHTYPKTFMIH